MKIYSWIIEKKLYVRSSVHIEGISIIIKLPEREETIYKTTLNIGANVDYWFQPSLDISSLDSVTLHIIDKEGYSIFHDNINTKQEKKQIKNRIFYVVARDSNKNIGKYYNEFMEKLDDNEWLCILDGDTLQTSIYFGKQIEDIIENNPEYSVFTSYTNRVGGPNGNW
jgi:hypothetical protein